MEWGAGREQALQECGEQCGEAHQTYVASNTRWWPSRTHPSPPLVTAPRVDTMTKHHDSPQAKENEGEVGEGLEGPQAGGQGVGCGQDHR